MKNLVVISIIVVLGLSSCWPSSLSFNDTGSLDPCLTHFQMDPLEIAAPNAPINYPIELTEAIKTGVQNRTRLLLASEKNAPQVTIVGKITNYMVSPVALQEGDNAIQNRLTISATMDIYFDCSPKKDYVLEMKVVSTRFANFDANLDISSVESQLLQEINDQIVQDVINQLLSNW